MTTDDNNEMREISAFEAQGLDFPRLKAIINSVKDPASILEYKDGSYIYVCNNSVHEKLTGVAAIEGMELSELVGQKTALKLQKHYEQALATGQPVSYEQTYSFLGKEQTWQTDAKPVTTIGGTRYLLLYSMDKTGIINMQRENERLTRRMVAMFDQHSAIMVLSTPRTGNIIDANPAACKLYGYTLEEFKGMTLHDLNVLPIDLVTEAKLLGKNGSVMLGALPHRMKNGDIRFLDIYACNVLEGDQELVYSIVFDATDREKLRQELMREKELLKTTIRSIGDGVVTTDERGVITGLNAAAKEITGWSEDSAVGRAFSEVFVLRGENDGEPLENPVERVLATGLTTGLAGDTELVRQDKTSVPIADSAAPIKTEDGRIVGVVMVFRDVSADRAHRKQIEYLSYHDALTGLCNRRCVEESVKLIDTEDNLPLSVVMGDVDGLKLTNDVFGHEAGDALLQSAAGLLKGACRNTDLVARWGGDEFMVLMPKTSLRAAEAVLARIKNADISLNGSGLRLSISLGCAVKESADTDLRAVMREADENMYRQKLLDGKSYRNAIVNTLLATVYEKSDETEEHSKRLEKYCNNIARRLWLSSKEKDELSLLALLHDIGKVSIDSHVLQKTGPLTSAEWAEVKRHPEIGFRIAQVTPELAAISQFILSHHERWDGTGYPHGLKGEEIPLVCRILAVADAFDAMTSDRAYRKAMPREQALAEIRRNAGTQFDPSVAHTFLEIMERAPSV